MGRDEYKLCFAEGVKFQFTRPAWGATEDMKLRLTYCLFQFTRPAWGATQRSCGSKRNIHVSIHAPRMGRDWLFNNNQILTNEFQFTRPAWGATRTPGRRVRRC